MDLYIAQKYIENVTTAKHQLNQLKYFIPKFEDKVDKNILLSHEECKVFDAVLIPDELLPQIYSLIEQHYTQVIQNAETPITNFVNLISVKGE